MSEQPTHIDILQRITGLEKDVEHLAQQVKQDREQSDKYREKNRQHVSEIHEYIVKERANKALVNRAGKVLAGLIAATAACVAIWKGFHFPKAN